VILLHVHSQNPDYLFHPQCPSLDPGVILLSGLKFKRCFCELEVQVVEIHKIHQKSDPIVARIAKIYIAMFSILLGAQAPVSFLANLES
jgi:hypothetical protein